jgi:hypothetical protein
VFRFLCEDWSPWIALPRLRERLPELQVEIKAGYLETGGSRKERGSEFFMRNMVAAGI